MTFDFRKPLHLPKNDNELYRTRRLHCAMETMIIRSLSEHILTRKPLFLKCSKAVQTTGFAIIRSFVKEDSDLDHKNLLNLKHQLFIELLKGGERSSSKVGEISEQALLALSLLPSGEWRKAAYVRSYVCGGLWSFRGTFANWARLRGSQYVSPEKPGLQDIRNESVEVEMPHQAMANPSSDDKAQEAPEAFEEVEEEEEEENEDGVDDELVEIFDSIQLQSQDEETLLEKILSALDLHPTELDDGNLPPVAFDE
jgi:hypothetical protein